MPLGPHSGIELPVDQGLRKNRIGRALYEDANIQALLRNDRERLSKFDLCLSDLSAAITESAVYKDYKRKRKLQMSDDVTFWNTVFTTIVRKHKGVERILRRNEDFGHLGFDNGVRMLVETLSSFDDTRASYLIAKDDLEKSLTKAYDLYHALLLIPLYITRKQERRLDEAKHKYIPTPEDLNPNLRFVDNLYVKALTECSALSDYVSEHPEADPSTWRDSDIMFASLLDTIVKSDLYKNYMETEAGDFKTDASFWREVMRSIIIPSDELSECLESKSVYWNDDLAIMSTFVLKTMRRSFALPEKEDEGMDVTIGKISLLPKFMNREDEEFGASLFELVVNNKATYREYIDAFIDPAQWDSERLAFMDIVIMMTAIAEIINFPSIPLPVTFNEYIEIANDYSTPRSGQFVNGILFSIVKRLNEEGIITKK